MVNKEDEEDDEEDEEEEEDEEDDDEEDEEEDEEFGLIFCFSFRLMGRAFALIGCWTYALYCVIFSWIKSSRIAWSVADLKDALVSPTFEHVLDHALNCARQEPGMDVALALCVENIAT